MSESEIDDMADIDTILLTLRKPTELKKVIDSVPKPSKAVPRNGLPVWYRLGLESKLPVPKMPVGRITFARGKIGEDVRRFIFKKYQPAFDLTDPYCHTVNYKYVPMHDPHLARHFSAPPARVRMRQLGLVTMDGRAVCSLQEFNQYRKSLYNQYMDQIHSEMKRLDERARDDLILNRVEKDTAHRQLVFKRQEKGRLHREKVEREHADEWAEKKRLAKEQEAKVKQRMLYLTEFKENQRVESAARGKEKADRIRQRVQAAAEMELRRTITMVRMWRDNEGKRLGRQRRDREARQRRIEDNANRKWEMRVDSQNQKIEQEALLLKIYTEDMAFGASRRAKRAEILAYNNDLNLQRIKLTNWKNIHGGKAKQMQIVRKMGVEFEKSKRGAKGMSAEVARKLAVDAVITAVTTPGDPLATLGRARARMDMETVLPNVVLRTMDEMLDTIIMEFTRRRCMGVLRSVEHNTYLNFKGLLTKPETKKLSWKGNRWGQIRLVSQAIMAQLPASAPSHSAAAAAAGVCFGEISDVPNPTPSDSEESGENIVLRSVKDRPPTPVPSMTKLAEVVFTDRVEDIPEPEVVQQLLPERARLIETAKATEKTLLGILDTKVHKGLDLKTEKVTLPRLRHPMEWGEAVETLAGAVVQSNTSPNTPQMRHVIDFLVHRVLKQLIVLIKDTKRQRVQNRAEAKNFAKSEAKAVAAPQTNKLKIMTN